MLTLRLGQGLRLRLKLELVLGFETNVRISAEAGAKDWD